MNDINKLNTQIKELKQVQHSLFAITKAAHTVKDSFTLYKKIHNIINKLVYTDNIYIALYNKEKQTLRFDYYVDSMDKDFTVGTELEFSDKSVTAYCLKKKKTVFKSKNELLDMQKKGVINPIGSIPETWLGVPLISNENIIGVITVQSYDSKHIITNKDKEILSFVSELLAMSIERQQLEEQQQHYQDKYI